MGTNFFRNLVVKKWPQRSNKGADNKFQVSVFSAAAGQKNGQFNQKKNYIDA